MIEAQRDVFISEIVKSMSSNKNIYFLSADFGAPALDELRDKFPNNFIHCGICEQAMLDISTGLALEGNIVFCYAMAPFLSLRCIEQIKCGPGLMSLPICIISVGVGIGYADAGPTHYTTEDYACLRSIPRTTVYTSSDSKISKQIALNYLKKPHFSYVRLDRDSLPDLLESNDNDINEGYRIYGNINNNSLALISHGRMSHLCKEIVDEAPNNFFLIDIIRSKPIPSKILNHLTKSFGFITVDEQTPGGSLYSAIVETCSANNMTKPSSYISLPDDYIFENGGRNYLLNKNGLNKESIINISKKINPNF